MERCCPSRSALRENDLSAALGIELDQVEGPHEDALVMPSVADAIERREPVLTTCHGKRCRAAHRSAPACLRGDYHTVPPFQAGTNPEMPQRLLVQRELSVCPEST